MSEMASRKFGLVANQKAKEQVQQVRFNLSFVIVILLTTVESKREANKTLYYWCSAGRRLKIDIG